MSNLKYLFNQYLKLIRADRKFVHSDCHVQVTGEPASLLMKQLISTDKPLMIARFGGTELSCMLNYHFMRQGFLRNVANVASGVPFFLRFKQSVVQNMHTLSGFFPSNAENLERFVEMSLQDIPEIDVLGTWLRQEQYLFDRLNDDHVRVHLEDLPPFHHSTPWSSALEGRKVLVVHPFDRSIVSQYRKRELLFTDRSVLPEFDLRTIRAVQSIANAETGYKSWFEALDAMTEQVYKTDFDIAILGCGAYGMPLAARIKRMGKQAIHMGGTVQCLFGIKGKRWEGPGYNYHRRFYNEFWVRPLEEETPERAAEVEEGCYW